MVEDRRSREAVAEPAAKAPIGSEPAVHEMSGSAPGGFEQGLAREHIIAPSLLLPGEIIICEWKPSLWYIALASIPIGAVGVLLLLVAGFVHELPASLRYLCIIVGAGVVGLRLVVAHLQWLGRTYVLTDRRVLTQYGVVSVEVQCMGLEDIASTFVAQAAAQKILGIGTIFFRSAAPTCSAMAWEHVAQPNEVHGRVVLQIDRWKRSLQQHP